MKRLALLLASFLVVGACARGDEVAEAPTPAQAETPDGGRLAPEPAEVFPVPVGTACAIRGGWSEDIDPAGLNVRAGPSETATIVGKLPPARYVAEFEREMRSGFGIREVRGGWVRIADPVDPEGKALGVKEGWVSARHVGFDLQTDKAFAEPDPSSAVVGRTTFVDGREERFAWRDLAECRGEWVRMTFTAVGAPPRQGWARGVCGGQETSCDGAKGDNLGPDEAG